MQSKLRTGMNRTADKEALDQYGLVDGLVRCVDLGFRRGTSTAFDPTEVLASYQFEAALYGVGGRTVTICVPARVETTDQYDIGTGTAVGAVPVRPRTDTGLEQHGLGPRTGTNPDQYDSRLVRPWMAGQYDIRTSTSPDWYVLALRTSTRFGPVQAWTKDCYDTGDRSPMRSPNAFSKRA
ncbi:hypothetical protein NPX13_g9795 [Xylaria arbuscula]|uniref:Uncharacterized protein n=1 Tax=Xylaria arbuscula TaxID=114810 RepID=A0A9W8N632_9PEZI|nr:hypothetical protein NPX13_g9795 [Xylaria arbuscula]